MPLCKKQNQNKFLFTHSLSHCNRPVAATRPVCAAKQISFQKSSLQMSFFKKWNHVASVKTDLLWCCNHLCCWWPVILYHSGEAPCLNRKKYKRLFSLNWFCTLECHNNLTRAVHVPEFWQLNHINATKISL